VSITALRKCEPAADGFYDLDDAPDKGRAALAVARAALLSDASDQTLSNIAARLPEQLPGVGTFTARDMAVLNAVDRVAVVDDIDYTGLFDYDDD
jgi:hypothetical protein